MWHFFTLWYCERNILYEGCCISIKAFTPFDSQRQWRRKPSNFGTLGTENVSFFIRSPPLWPVTAPIRTLVGAIHYQSSISPLPHHQFLVGPIFWPIGLIKQAHVKISRKDCRTFIKKDIAQIFFANMTPRECFWHRVVFLSALKNLLLSSIFLRPNFLVINLQK